MAPYLSWLLCGFRKGYNAQHALMRAIEKWKACLDNGGKIGAVFMDLSKAFDCIRHDLLIAKLHAYGFSREALLLVYSYLENRQQRVKINGSFSSYKHLRFGVLKDPYLDLYFSISISMTFCYRFKKQIYVTMWMIQPSGGLAGGPGGPWPPQRTFSKGRQSLRGAPKTL